MATVVGEDYVQHQTKKCGPGLSCALICGPGLSSALISAEEDGMDIMRRLRALSLLRQRTQLKFGSVPDAVRQKRIPWLCHGGKCPNRHMAHAGGHQRASDGRVCAQGGWLSEDRWRNCLARSAL